MPDLLKAALTYFAAVFAAAFGLGILRVTMIVPRIGDLAAVAIELPIVLCLSWIVAGRVLAGWPLTLTGCIAMGALAFAFLLTAECAIGVLVFGQTPSAYLATLAQPSGLLGLAGQIGFALIPGLRLQGRG
jgi:hypothetical protein